MSSFHLTDIPPPLPIKLGEGVQLNKDSLLGFKAFDNWLTALRTNLGYQKVPGHAFQHDPWRLVEIRVHSVTMFKKDKIGFMNIEAILERSQQPNRLERVVFLRGGSVAVLMILRPKEAKHERYVVLTEQPRVGACGMSFLEIPAGMLDDSEEIAGKAIEEIKQGTGFTLQKGELIDMTKLALAQSGTREHLQPAMYPSPANLDEFIPLLLWEKEIDRKELESLKGKLEVPRKSEDLITLRLCDYEVLWKDGARDAKTLAAWALYEGLSRAGLIEQSLRDIRIGKFESGFVR